jgi:hypothetical protein
MAASAETKATALHLPVASGSDRQIEQLQIKSRLLFR